ncbi:hypothetical protein ACFLUO_02825 [Chloroflexota bacterium]
MEDNNTFIILHPALEIREYIACVSFRQKVVQNGKISDEETHFLSVEDDILFTAKDTLKLDNRQIIFEKKLLPTDTVYIDKLMQWTQNPTPPDAHELYESLKATLQCYVELPQDSYGLIAIWIIGTYFYRAFSCYPYLSFLGPKETGKSNTLECMKYLCFNAVKTKLTLASLCDTADSLRGTILIDQAHNLEGELKEILVDGYKQGGGKRRIIDISSQGRKVLEYDTYCPKVFASLEPLPDDLADRTFTINMAPAGKFYPSPSASKRDWKQIRTDMVKLMLTTYWEVNSLRDEMAESEGNRFGELWLPICAILKLVEADQQESDNIKQFCENKFSQVKYELNDWDYILVSGVKLWNSDEAPADELLSYVRTEIDGEIKPGKQWLGKGMKRLGLMKEKKGNKHKTIYILDKEQADKLLGGNEISGGSGTE